MYLACTTLNHVSLSVCIHTYSYSVSFKVVKDYQGDIREQLKGSLLQLHGSQSQSDGQKVLKLEARYLGLAIDTVTDLLHELTSFHHQLNKILLDRN